MIRFSLYAGAVALSALAIAGCGGDGDETTAPAAAPVESPAALSKDELVAQGDAICAEVNAAVGTAVSTDTSGSASQAADLYSAMVERLKDLGAPSDDAGGYPEFIAAAEGLAQAESDVQLAAERGEAEGLATAESEASSALASFRSAATSYGFEQCGEGPSAPAPGSAGAPAESEPESPEGVEEEEGEVTPEEVEEAPETEAGGAGTEAGGGAEAGGGSDGGGESSDDGGSSGGIGPG